MLLCLGGGRVSPPADNVHVLQLGFVQLCGSLAVHAIREHHEPALQLVPVLQSDLCPCSEISTTSLGMPQGERSNKPMRGF